MTTNNNSNNKEDKSPNPKEENGLKGQQDIPKNSFEEDKENLQDQCCDYMYKQSHTASTISRQLCLGIMGTVWVLSFLRGHIEIPNGWLLAALILCVFYLLTDLSHYVWDTCSYYDETNRMDGYSRLDDLRYLHEPVMDKIFLRSHRMFILKYIIILLAAVTFIIGLVILYLK